MINHGEYENNVFEEKVVPYLKPLVDNHTGEVHKVELDKYKLYCINGGKFGNGAFYRTYNPIVNGGLFGENALQQSMSAVINGGRFENGALYSSKDITITGGEFEDRAIQNCENVIISGGIFGLPNKFKQGLSLDRSRDVYAFLPDENSGFEGLEKPESGIIVARNIKDFYCGYIWEKCDPLKLRIYAVNFQDNKDTKIIQRIEQETLEKIKRIIQSKGGDIKTGLEKAVGFAGIL